MKVAIVIDIFRLREQLIDSNAIVCAIADMFRKTLPHIDITRLKFPESISAKNYEFDSIRLDALVDYERGAISKEVYENIVSELNRIELAENNSCKENLRHTDKFDFERIEKLVYYLFSTGPFSNMVDIEVIDYKIDYSYMLVVLEGKEVNK